MPHSTKEKWDEWYGKNKPKRNATYNAWYARNKEKIAAQKHARYLNNLESANASAARSRRSRRQVLAEYKLDRGCAICGYKGHPDALDFDHLPGTDKINHVGKMYRAAWADVLNEIEKCQVLCANCHRIITAQRTREKRAIRKAEKEKKDQQLRLHFA